MTAHETALKEANRHPDRDRFTFKLGPLEMTARGGLARQALYLVSFVSLTVAGVYFTDSRIVARLDRMQAELRRVEDRLGIVPSNAVGDKGRPSNESLAEAP